MSTKALACLLGSAIIALIAGCEAPSPPPDNEEPQIRLIGFAGDSFYNTDTLRKEILIPKNFETYNMLHFTAELDATPYQNFEVILGRPIDNPNKAKGRFKQGSLIFVLDCGWAYANGELPRVETNRATGSAEGSRMLVHVTTPPNSIHRFFFLEGQSMKVTSRLVSGAQIEMTAPGDINHYVEVDAGGHLAGPIALPPLGHVSGLREFRDTVLQRAEILKTAGP